MLTFTTMKNPINGYLISIVMICCPVSAGATQSSYELKGIYASGAANIESSNVGEYVYKPIQADKRVSVPAFMTGPIERQSYDFFSAEEEQALIQYRDKQLAEFLKEKVIVRRKKHFKKTQNYIWPKVVVRETEICVPELVNSESPDWKEHLTCYQPGKNSK